MSSKSSSKSIDKKECTVEIKKKLSINRTLNKENSTYFEKT